MRQFKIIQSLTIRTSSSVDIYLAQIAKKELISTDEEVELSRLIKQGNSQAAKRMIEANLRFVVSVAKQYQNQGLDLIDLINEGNIGLIKAAYRFDETRGFKFISYAVWWIRQSILQAIAEQSRIVRLPLNQTLLINKIRKASNEFLQQNEREPSDEELSQYLEINIKKISEARNQNNIKSVYTDENIDSENNESSFWERHVNDQTDPTDKKLDLESLQIDVQRFLSKLNSKERMVITMFYGLDGNGEKSKEQIARILSIKTERVRQIKEKAIRKMKQTRQIKTIKQHL